ncbi:hypothetical protein Tco_1028297 [Tanacetum coccineum]|uniref:Synaptobrevin, longin-like domain protein n=1 Tax=Tanacetum coccineum TaxID=301880 RepID=A0ABQ5G0E3_9ASTR
MVACLERTKGNVDFHQIVDFLNASTIRYSLTISPTIYASYIEKFWATSKSKIFNNETQIHSKVDGKIIVISESSMRSNLHFNDEDGVASLTNSKILENLALMGYEIVYDKLTFQKAFFSPQWKYLIHTILHCLRLKSTAWNEFSTNIASAVICLANNQKFNFYKLIFDEPFNDTYETPKQTQNVFANMRRKGKCFSRTVTPLFASMLVPQVVEDEVSGQPSKPQPPPLTAPPSKEGQVFVVGDEVVHKELGDIVERAATTAASLDAMQDSGDNTPGSDEERVKQHELTDNVPPTPHDSPLPGALSQKVEGLESDLKKTKKLYATSSKKIINRGRSLIEEMDLDARISLVPLHVEVQGRYEQNLETKEGFGDGHEVSTVAQVSTTSTFVCTASPQRNADTTADDLILTETLIEIKKSAAKDKGKAKMDETESPRKMKQRERVQISRDEEVAQKLQEEFDAAERQRMAQVHQAAQGFTYAEWDDVLARVAADEDLVQQLQAAEAKRNKPMTPAQQKDYMSNYIKNQEGEASGLGEEQSAEKEKELSEEELQKLLVIVLVEELVIQPLQVKYPIIDWEVYSEDTRRYWRIIRDLVKERFSTIEPTDDKEKELWIELKRLFEPNKDDFLWKLQSKRTDIFMWLEKRNISIQRKTWIDDGGRLLVEADSDDI